MLKKIRLRSTLIILVLVAVLPNVGLSLYTYAQNQQAELERTRRDLYAIGRLAAANEQQLIEGVRQILATVSSGPSVRRTDLADLCNEFLGNVAAASPIYLHLGVLESGGKQRCPREPGSAFGSSIGTTIVTDALNQRRFLIQGFVQDDLGKKAIAFSMPVFDYKNQFSGASFAALDLELVDRQLKALHLPDNVSVFMTDHTGTLLASSKESKNRIGEHLEFLPKQKIEASSQESSFETTDSRGIEMIHVSVMAGADGDRHLKIMVSAEKKIVLGPAIDVLRTQFFALFVITLIGVALAWSFAQWQVARPVGRLLRKMQAVGRGETGGEDDLLVDAPADFSQLQEGFSDMLVRLRQQQDQMLRAQKITRVGFYEVDLVKGLIHASTTVYEIFGLDADMGAIPISRYESMIHPSDRQAVEEYRKHLASENAPRRGKYRIIRQDGDIRHIDVYGTAELGEGGEHIRYSGALQDVTEQQRQRRLFDVQSQINEAIVRLRSREELFARVCQIAVEAGELPRTVVAGLDSSTGAIGLVTRFGRDDGYEAVVFHELNIHTSDAPLAVAMREGKYVVCNDSATDDRVIQWRDLALERGFRAVAIVPLFTSGTCTAALIFTADQRYFFQREESYLLQSIGENLSYALTAIAQEAARSAATEALRLTQAAVESSSDGIVICDAQQSDFPLVYVNPAFERMTGYPSAEVLGKNCRFLQQGDTEQSGLNEIRSALREHRTGEATLCNFTRDGAIFWNSLRVAPVRDAQGRLTHYVGIQTDVTERIHYEQDLAHHALYDALTSLPNRQLLEARLEQAIAAAKRNETLVGVAFLDLDNFKIFNDSIGHAAGDHVLRTVATRMSGCVRPTDTVARIGGDEFVLVMGELGGADELLSVISRIRAEIAVSIQLDGKEYFAAASIGLAVFPRDGATAEQLIQHADFAMYKAKEDGRGVVRAYDPSLDLRGGDRLELERALRQALIHKEFVLHYQPKCDAHTGELCGVEALVRWNHPDRGMVPPIQFIALAEKTGLIVAMGEWVLEEACRQNRIWRDLGIFSVPVAVNVSGIQFKQGDILKTITDVLERTGLEPQGLHLEITESVMMGDPEEFIRTLNALRGIGVSIALDDFGTGYSSLSYLKRFPIDYVKIDRSFVRDITSDPMDAGICSAIIAMAHNLRMQVIAEGVETQEQADFLRHGGCDQLQGYLVGHPQPANGFFYHVRQLGIELLQTN